MHVNHLKMNSKVIIVLDEIVNKLGLIYGENLKKIILFGSYAREEQDPGSDMDLMVLVDMEEQEIKKQRNQVLDLTVDLTTRYGIVLSIIENNHDFFYEWVGYLPFFRNVANEGIEIYG
ncbi:MAG: nucleotidyltransferase domain-containing protein [Candidatus Desulfaltia sp.]|nr:nucleotidyltransferase domain-containing protein [Candidatus Desulfaltia sp.]